jgi:hypothetical protein
MGGFRPVSRQVSLRQIFEPPVSRRPWNLQAGTILVIAVVVDLAGLRTSLSGPLRERLGREWSVWIRLTLA